MASAAWGTVYNTFCIAQEFARANGEFHPAEEEWDLGKGGLWDPYRKGVQWCDHATAIEERAEHARTACRAIKTRRSRRPSVSSEGYSQQSDSSAFSKRADMRGRRHPVLKGG